MATKIKRSLFIGLGGTGMSTLLSTKRFFIETYGTVPPMVGFLGIDTDENFFHKNLPSKKGVVSLSPGEICTIQVAKPMDIYRLNENSLFEWLPKKNVRALTSLTAGAGQVRSNGRFALSVNYNSIVKAINAKKNSITNAIIANNTDYEVINGTVEVHLVFSVGGGTGCGTFIDLAYLITENTPDVKLFAYAVLPGVFEAFMGGPQVRNVKPNAFGALVDLDYLMHIFEHNNSHTFRYTSGPEINVDKPPFPAVVVIDNKNNQGDTYTHIDQITEMLGLALVTTAGEFSSANASALDNVEKVIAGRSMDIVDKLAWASGMGMSEILFDGEELSKIYSLKAMRRLIERMTNTTINFDLNSLANSWIDSPEVNIREDRGQDNVIDYLLVKSPKVKFTDSSINQKSNPKIDIESYFDQHVTCDKDSIDSKIDLLLNKTRNELIKKVISLVNSDAGIGTSLNFLDEIDRQISIFQKEMNDELRDWQTKDKNLGKRMESSVFGYIDALNLGIFVIGKKNKVRDALDEMVNQVNAKSISTREIMRRDSALRFFTGLRNKIADERRKIKTFQKTLELIYNNIGKELNQIQIVGERQQIFVINLHNEYSKNIEVNNNDFTIEDFARSINQHNYIYDVLEADTQLVTNTLHNYSMNLPESTKYRDMSINEVLVKLSKEDYINLIKRAITKSDPLITLDYRGHTQPELHEAFIVGVPDKANSVLRRTDKESNENNDNGKPSFSYFVGSDNDVEIISTGSKDRIIIYRQRAAVPVFTLAGIQEYEHKYNHANIDCHFDNTIYEKIKSGRFSLYPKNTHRDDTIELWVKAIVFGFVTNDAGIYNLKTKNKDLTDALRDYKFKLNDVNYRREQAFKKFKEIRPRVREELIQNIERQISDLGSSAFEEIRRNVKLVDNYISKDLAKVGMDKEWILSFGQEEINNLILEEIEYIEKSF